ncbi:MAG: hypothetical protein V4812_18060 [Pseudomonadota bacterium]
MFTNNNALVLAGFALFTNSAFAAPTLDEVCDMTTCRPEISISVRISKDQASEINLLKAPYYFQNTANVVSGETIFLEAIVVAGKIENLKYIKSNINPDKTIVMTLAAIEDDPSKISTVLKISNPLNEALTYKAMLHSASANEFQKTTTCPVTAKGSSYESWAFPVFQMALMNFKLVSEAEAESQGCM